MQKQTLPYRRKNSILEPKLPCLLTSVFRSQICQAEQIFSLCLCISILESSIKLLLNSNFFYVVACPVTSQTEHSEILSMPSLCVAWLEVVRRRGEGSKVGRFIPKRTPKGNPVFYCYSSTWSGCQRAARALLFSIWLQNNGPCGQQIIIMDDV